MGTLAVLALIVVAIYVVSCYSFPFSNCPWCGSKQRTTDKRGHWRVRRRWWPHRLLHPGDPYVRLGARLMGRGR